MSIIILLLALSLCNLCASVDNTNTVEVLCLTTASSTPIKIEIRRDWAPKGSERFLELVTSRYFERASFFRVVKGFLAQFGIGATREVWKHWNDKGPIPDDPKSVPFKRGYLSFAGAGPNSRTTELFLVYSENPQNFGNHPWEVPIGFVSPEEMDKVIEKLYDGYGDVPPFGNGPSQSEMYQHGNTYLQEKFPKLDYIRRCAIVSKYYSFPEEEEKQVDESREKPNSGDNSIIKESTKEDAGAPRSEIWIPLVIITIFVCVVTVYVLRKYKQPVKDSK